jgi:hypothetical protein
MVAASSGQRFFGPPPSACKPATITLPQLLAYCSECTFVFHLLSSLGYPVLKFRFKRTSWQRLWASASLTKPPSTCALFTPYGLSPKPLPHSVVLRGGLLWPSVSSTPPPFNLRSLPPHGLSPKSTLHSVGPRGGLPGPAFHRPLPPLQPTLLSPPILNPLRIL